MRYLGQTGLKRLWDAVRDKYERYGRVGGTVKLDDVSTDEVEALSGLLAINLYGQTRFAVQLTKIDAALQASKFDVTLEEALGYLFPDMTTREQRVVESEANWSAFCMWARHDVGLPSILDWIDRLSQRDAPGYRTYLDCYQEYVQTGQCDAWSNAVQALELSLSSNLVWRLPVFAAHVTGNPHGLDRDTLAGKVFYWGLVALIGDEAGMETLTSMQALESVDDLYGADSPSEYTRMVYSKAGIVLDDVSSIVWVGNWEGFYDAPVAIPLITLESRITELPAVEAVYVVENPSVFAELTEQIPTGIPVVCTSGQPSVAALRLLDMAVASGATLYYNGDFDVKGLQMTIFLRQRYGHSLEPWHMDTCTYRSASNAKQPGLSEREVQALKNLKVDWDDMLIETMASVRRKVFQEQFIPVLVSDFVGGLV
ncbi:TIGR02679 domain-containing protein [Alicyclobacillus dauci]|uniref:TIGR02679 domain-containing protein n=1 Tax=Alicyclobacillus dauci TaxID=1475485 RepID=A0ABY6Z9J9_9BACL|nr:TIGR02679 domain-containing protein [Alicyclobacillus dauci]WAH36348.1 TIGR02679 domain-containing protein [Alicyclobacillus dauci]WAH39385.1 TIGR02679 domain-containing protein [Alicyclobacillus dauci]